MKRGAILVLLGLPLACGGAASTPTPVVKSGTPPVSAVVSSPWRTNLLPFKSLSVDMPGVAEERFDSLSFDDQNKLYHHYLTYTSANEKRSFSAGVYHLKETKDGEHVGRIVETLRETFATIDSDEHVTHEGLEGISIRGKMASGEFVAMRVFTFALYVYALRVENPSNEQLKRDAARFFGSFHWKIPFRVFSFPEEYATVAVPTSAPYTSSYHPIAESSGLITQSHIFTMGKNDGYSVSIVPFPHVGESVEAAEDLLDEIIDNVAKKKGFVVERKVAVTVDRAPGRDVVFATDHDTFERDLMVVKNRRGYIATRESPKKSEMFDEAAQTFFESFTIGRAP